MSSRQELSRFVEPGTRLNVFLGYCLLLFIGPILVLGTLLMTYGLALIGWLIFALTTSSRTRRAQAQLHGSAVQVTPHQFPEIYTAANALAARIGMEETPDIYIIEDNTQNAFAMKHGRKHCVVLMDDIVYGALATGNEKALQFILAHELAHHALGHTGVIRGYLSRSFKKLSRLDEYSCDRIAHWLVADPTAARDAIALLTIGPQLFTRVNRAALDQQVREVQANKYSVKSERTLTHPLLLHRYARLSEAVVVT